MKKLIKIIIVSLLFINCKAQVVVNSNTFNQGDNSGKYFKDLDDYLLPFVGTWENTTGNITFRIILWKEAMKPVGYPTDYYMDNMGGSFMIIQNVGQINEVVLHNSVKYYPQSGVTSESVFNAGAGVNSLGGWVEDNGALGGTDIVTAFFKMTKLSPTTAHWKVKPRRGINAHDSDYSVPMDCILTKVN